MRHGAKRKRCSSEGCTKNAQKGGVCVRHGAKAKRCSSEGCSNKVVQGGVCIRHGASWTKKKCSIEGCTTLAKRGGVCIRHGASRNAQDESAAFGSELQLTTTTQTICHHRASRAVIRGQEGSAVPEEVTIICEEIVEV